MCLCTPVAREFCRPGWFRLAVRRPGRGTAYLHARRGGERVHLAEAQGDVLSRHDLDELYNLTLRAGLGTDVIILSALAGEDVVPADVYRSLEQLVPARYALQEEGAGTVAEL